MHKLKKVTMLCSLDVTAPKKLEKDQISVDVSYESAGVILSYEIVCVLYGFWPRRVYRKACTHRAKVQCIA